MLTDADLKAADGDGKLHFSIHARDGKGASASLRLWVNVRSPQGDVAGAYQSQLSTPQQSSNEQKGVSGGTEAAAAAAAEKDAVAKTGPALVTVKEQRSTFISPEEYVVPVSVVATASAFVDKHLRLPKLGLMVDPASGIIAGF